jgi:putative effector of murein hydrolase
MEPLAVAVADPVQPQPAATALAVTVIGVIGVQLLLNCPM